MGEARRRQQAGNTKPDKRWHKRKAGERHATKAERELRQEAATNPMLTATGMALK